MNLTSPKNWKTTTLGEIAEIAGGGTPSTKEASFWEGDIPWITPKDLSGYKSVYIEGGERHISEEGLKNSSVKLLPENSILFSSRAPIGYIAINKIPVTTNQGFKSLIPKDGVDYKFLYYWLSHNKGNIEKQASGSTFAEVSGTVMKNIEITLPESPSEQKEIAAILGSLDDKIELLCAQNKTLESIAQAMFKEWFVEFRFPGYERVKVDGVPEGWKVGRLGDVVEVKGGTTPSTTNPNFWNGTIHWTSPKDLSDRKDIFLTDTEKKITEEGLNQIGSGLLPKGTLLLSSRAPIGYLAISDINISINQGYIAMPPNSKFSNYFMYLWIKHNMQEIIGAANGSTFLEISKTSFKNLDCVIPSDDILKSFSDLITPQFEKMRNNVSEIRNLSSLRDQLLDKMFSN